MSIEELLDFCEERGVEVSFRYVKSADSFLIKMRKGIVCIERSIANYLLGAPVGSGYSIPEILTEMENNLQHEILIQINMEGT